MAFTTGGQIEAITWNTSQGFSTGLSTFIAQNYAAGQKSRVKQAWHTTLWMTGVFGSLCSLLFIFFGSEVFSIFVPEAEAYRVGGDSPHRRLFTNVHDDGNHHARCVLRTGTNGTACYCQYRMQLYAHSGSIATGTYGYGSGRHLVGSEWNHHCQRSDTDSLVHIHQKENSLKKNRTDEL